ncbi:MAG: helix-turn-helix domain-containing protein [Candidatus Moranbacteria bacterium]|nr:helix-turn-helix domain-containing protein [Candidatus Moranbacteria bacterium]
MLTKILQKIGLNEKEAKVYLAALELGETTLQRIVTKAGISRTTIYDVLESLKQRGLISAVKKSKKLYYYAEEPDSLQNELDEKQDLLKKALPQLIAMANLIDRKPKIRYYEGLEGIKEVYMDSLRFPQKEILSWVAEEAFYKFDEDFLLNFYHPRRIKQKSWSREIVSDHPLTREYQQEEIGNLRKTKILSATEFPMDVSINLYGKNKIGVVSFEEEMGLIVESEKIYITLKSLFEFMWIKI